MGDVSNVVFTNGAIVNENNEVFIYYASSDTRLHVATTTIDKLVIMYLTHQVIRADQLNALNRDMN